MQKASYKKITAVVLWASFTLALLSWWVVFAFRQLNQLKSLGLDLDDKILRHQKMIIYEGITLFFCLGLGAFFLLYFVYVENSRLKERRDFFSAFTHDLKTSISVLRLKLEKLIDSSPEIEEVQKIGTRISIQLQNALQVSYFEAQELLLEKIPVIMEINYIRGLWPDLSVSFKGDQSILADRIAFRSIVNNIIQNAVEHAGAKAIYIEQKAEENMVVISFSSDGERSHDFSETEIKTGVFRRRSEEGSGLGLKISKKLINKMGGRMNFSKSVENQLIVNLILKNSEVS